VLHGAAVAGQDFELDVIAAITAGGEEQVIDALEAARVAGLLDELGGAPVRYRFAHALVQQTLLDEIPTARRLRFHRAIAEAIERLRADRIDRYRAALARHWYEAGTEPERALDASVAAADRALAQYADREAFQWLTQAADLFDDAGASDVTRVDVMTMTGEALRRIGDPSHREVLLEAGRLAERAGDAPRMAKAALANGRFWQSDATGIDTERVAALEAAVAALGDDDPNTRALLLIKLSVENIYAPDPTYRRALAEEAVATARRQGDPFTLGNVLSVRHNVLLSHETVDQRRRENEELLVIAEAVGDPNLRYYSRTYGYFWRFEIGDVEGARNSVREAAEISRTLAQPMFEWIVSWMEVALARFDGDLDAATATLARSREIGTEAGIPDAEFFHSVQRVTLLVDRGDPTTLAECRALCEIAPPHYPGLLGTMVLLEIVAGELGSARKTLDALLASPFAPWSEGGGPPDSALSYAAGCAAVEAALGVASDFTRTIYDYMDPWRGRFFGNIAYWGPTEAYLAALAPLAGHADDLDALLDTALRISDGINAPINAMYTRLFGACGLRTRNRSGDRDRAGRLVDEALVLGDRTGAGIARAAAEAFPALRD